MTKENKDILLKYLCMALPYDVMVDYESHINILNEVDPACKDIDYITVRIQDLLYDNPTGVERLMCAKNVMIESIKPYLRPMSSMSEEEKKEMHNLLSPEGTAIYGYDGISMPMNHYGEFVSYEFMNRIIQYLLENHFDFMNLIPKDLAIEVTEENNPYKE